MLVVKGAYECDYTVGESVEQGYEPVVPPMSRRRGSWIREVRRYSRLNEIDRLFGRLKRFRRIDTRYEILDVIFLSGL